MVGVEKTVGVGVDVGSAAHAAANKTRNNARPTMYMALRLLLIMSGNYPFDTNVPSKSGYLG